MGIKGIKKLAMKGMKIISRFGLSLFFLEVVVAFDFVVGTENQPVDLSNAIVDEVEEVVGEDHCSGNVHEKIHAC